MSIHLYQSKKAKTVIGDKVYSQLQDQTETPDPLLVWYVDVFNVERKKYLVFANPLTKLSFFVFEYSKKRYPDFLSLFREKLGLTIQNAGIDAGDYMAQADKLLPYSTTDRSASAHLSRIKVDIGYVMEVRTISSDDQYNASLSKSLVTYGKEYGYPASKFAEVLSSRNYDNPQGLELPAAKVVKVKALLKQIQMSTGMKKKNAPYRVMEIPKNTNLYYFGIAIVRAFQFDPDHAFGFYDNLKHWTDAACSYEFPEMMSIGFDDGEQQHYSILEASVADLFNDKSEWLMLFDYGDEWEFILSLEGEKEMDYQERYPKVVESKFSAPDQYGHES